MRSLLVCLLLLTPALHAMEKDALLSHDEKRNAELSAMGENEPAFMNAVDSAIDTSTLCLAGKKVFATDYIFMLANGFSKVNDKAFRLISNLICQRIRHSPDWHSANWSRRIFGRFVRCEDGKVRARDAQTGEIVPEGWYANEMAFNYDGSRLAVADECDTCIFDTETGKKTCTIYPPFRNQSGMRTSVITFSRSGKQIATAYDSSSLIRVSYTRTGAGRSIPDDGYAGYGYTAYKVTALAFNHDGALLAVLRPDKIRIIDMKTDKLHRIITNVRGEALAFNHDGTLLASAGKILDVNTSAVVCDYTLSFCSLAFNHDGTQLACASCNRDQLTLINRTTGARKKMALDSHDDHDGTRRLAYSHDSTQLAVLCGDNSISVIDTNRIRIKHTITLKPLVRAVALSRDGTKVYAAQDDGVLQIFDIKLAREIVGTLSLDDCELLQALALAKSDSKELALERIAVQRNEVQQAGFRQKLLQKFGFGPEKPSHKIARINASEEHWEAWLALQKKLPYRAIQRLAPFIVRGDGNPDGYELVEEHD